jgi:hypothetical protein
LSEGVATRISATLTHAVPTFKKARSGLSMCSKSAICEFSSQATARFGVSASQVTTSCDLFISALAAASPGRVFWFAGADLLKGGQSTERLAGDIDEFGHGDLPSGCNVK